MNQEAGSTNLNVDLSDLVCQIVDLWGEGEPLDGERIAEIASNLYNCSREAVINAIVDGLNTGRLKGKFYSPNYANRV